MKWSREMYVACYKGAKIVQEVPALGIQVYFLTTHCGKPAALLFKGKGQKPVGYHSYSSGEKREEIVVKWIAEVQAQAEAKKAARAERANFQHTLKIGDILVSSWGWEQTNVDFYEVTAVKGKTVTIREIAQEKEQTQFMAGNCKPKPGHFIGEPMVKRVGFRNSIGFTSYKSAFPAEQGKSYYYSEYA